ncbi:hypothetical protein MY11210_009724, partial [Beauveria gryllotalpidicola]
MAQNCEKKDSIALWQIDDFYIQYYNRCVTDDGRVYYVREANRDDLPARFWQSD